MAGTENFKNLLGKAKKRRNQNIQKSLDPGGHYNQKICPKSQQKKNIVGTA